MEERELILRAQEGDMRAFGELVRHHDRAILSLAARFVGNAEDAKDVFQEVLINMHKGLPSFQFRSAFATWVHRITVNACLSHKRRQPSVHHLAFPIGNEDDGLRGSLLTEPSSPEPGPDHIAVQTDTAEQVRRALMTLSPRQRMVFTLHHDEGYTLREIGASLRCTEGAVKRYLFEATRRLRVQLHHLLERKGEVGA